MGRQGQGPRRAGSQGPASPGCAGEMGIFLLQEPPFTCWSSLPAYNKYSEWLGWGRNGIIRVGTQQVTQEGLQADWANSRGTKDNSRVG